MKSNGPGNGRTVIAGINEGQRAVCLLSSGSQVRVLPGAPMFSMISRGRRNARNALL
jgi:hypothetical protein